MDEFIKAEGAEAFQQRIDQAQNSFLYEIDVLQRQYDMKDPQSKTAFYQETAKKLMQANADNYDGLVKDVFFYQSAKELEGVTL